MVFNIWSEFGAKFGASLERSKLAPNSLQTNKNISFSNVLSMGYHRGLVWSKFGALSPRGKNNKTH